MRRRALLTKPGTNYRIRQHFWRGKDKRAEFDVAFTFKYSGYVTQNDAQTPQDQTFELSDMEVCKDSTGIKWAVPNITNTKHFWLPITPGIDKEVYTGCQGFAYDLDGCGLTSTTSRRFGTAGCVCTLSAALLCLCVQALVVTDVHQRRWGHALTRPNHQRHVARPACCCCCAMVGAAPHPRGSIVPSEPGTFTDFAASWAPLLDAAEMTGRHDMLYVRNGETEDRGTGVVYGNQGGSDGIVLMYWLCESDECRCPPPPTPTPPPPTPKPPPPPPKLLFACVGGVCAQTSDGTGASRAVCQQACLPPPPKVSYVCCSGAFTCKANQTGCRPATANETGVTLVECTAVCRPR